MRRKNKKSLTLTESVGEIAKAMSTPVAVQFQLPPLPTLPTVPLPTEMDTITTWAMNFVNQLKRLPPKERQDKMDEYDENLRDSIKKAKHAA